MSATCERCGATVNGSVCDLCGGTRLISFGNAPVPPPPPVLPKAPPIPVATPAPAIASPVAEGVAADPVTTPTFSPPPGTATMPQSTGSTAPRPALPLGRRGIILGSVAVLGLLLAVGGALLLGGRGGAAASAPQPVEATAPGAPDAGESSGSAAGGGARCWDGSDKVSLAECTEPSGAAGLRYVYPEYDALGSCESMDYRAGRTVTYDCTLDKHTLMRYRWWRDTDEGLGHYEGKYSAGSCQPLTAAGEDIGILCRDAKPVDGRYHMSGFFRDHFSFSVEAATPQRQDELLQTIELRHPNDFSGYALATGPKGTVHVLS